MNESVEVRPNDRRNFTILPNYIIRCGGPTNLFRVIAIIASYSWEGGKCKCSVSRIAEEAGMNRHTVIDAIRTWEERGQIEVEKLVGIGMKITTKFDFSATSTPWSTSAPVGTAPVPREAPPPVPRRAPNKDISKDSNKDSTFERFWKLYPRKVGKKNAKAQWDKLNMTDSLLEKIVASVTAYSKSEGWTKDGGKFIPHPERFIKHERWEDVITVHKTRNAGFGTFPGKYDTVPSVKV